MSPPGLQNRPSTTVEEFLVNHPEVQVGRTAYDKLESELNTDDTFSIRSKPVENMVLHQEFTADKNLRVFVVALIDDEKALAAFTEEGDESRCDCAESNWPDHLMFDHVVRHEKADCVDHRDASEPDPDCAACWPEFSGRNCSV